MPSQRNDIPTWQLNGTPRNLAVNVIESNGVCLVLSGLIISVTDSRAAQSWKRRINFKEVASWTAQQIVGHARNVSQTVASCAYTVFAVHPRELHDWSITTNDSFRADCPDFFRCAVPAIAGGET